MRKTPPAAQRIRLGASPNDAFPFHIGASEWVLTDAQRREYGGPLQAKTDFAISFDGGTSFLDAKYRSMLVTVQCYLATCWHGKSKGRVSGDWRLLKPFIRFCVEVRGVCNFSEMWGIDLYIAYIKKRGKNYAGNTQKKGAMNAHALFKYLDPVKQLWAFSHNKSDGLKVEPWAGRTSGKAAGVRKSAANRVLPYELWEFAGLVRVSMETIAEVDDLCSLLTQKTNHWTKIAAFTKFRTAVSIVIFALGSLRPDELFSLKQSCLTEGTLTTADGIVDVTWIEGKIFKDQPPGGTPHRWLAAAEIRIACEAMNKVWEALTLCLRKKIVSPQWCEAIEDSKGLLLPKLLGGGPRLEMKSSVSLTGLKKFCCEDRCASFLRSGPVTQKRFRPTLARAFARLQLGDVTYFMHHWGHQRWRTSMGYFLTFAEEDFKREVTDAVDGEKHDLVRDILSSRTPLLGKRGESFESVRRLFSTMTFARQRDVVHHIARGHEIRIGPQSLCMAANGTKLCPQDCLYEEIRCLGCHNGVITARHLEAWRDMEVRTLDLNAEFNESSPAYESMRKNLLDIQETIAILEKSDENA